MGNKGLHMAAFTLVIIGGVNWLLVGLFQWDIGAIFGGMGSLISRIVYLLVGVSAVYLAATHKKDCRVCSGGMAAPSGNMGGGNMKM